MRTLYVLLVSCALLATCLALIPQDKDEGEDYSVEVTETPGGDSGAEQSKESSEEKVEPQVTRAQRKRNRKLKWRQRKTKYVPNGLEQRLQKLEQTMQELAEQMKDTKVTLRSYKFKKEISTGIDLETAMKNKKWLLEFPRNLQENYLAAQKLILKHGEYALFHTFSLPSGVAEILLMGGANVNLQEPTTLDTVLHKQLEDHGNDELIELFCNFGANFTAVNAKKITPAMLATKARYSQPAITSCKPSN